MSHKESPGGASPLPEIKGKTSKVALQFMLILTLMWQRRGVQAYFKNTHLINAPVSKLCAQMRDSIRTIHVLICQIGLGISIQVINSVFYPCDVGDFQLGYCIVRIQHSTKLSKASRCRDSLPDYHINRNILSTSAIPLLIFLTYELTTLLIPRLFASHAHISYHGDQS